LADELAGEKGQRKVEKLAVARAAPRACLWAVEKGGPWVVRKAVMWAAWKALLMAEQMAGMMALS